ncbi:hypothetical protein C8J56DRAFT_903437 [Mycena floridula]|nr:hypothetical protein C8J56DRAFT_903437 [Mycena floridula]
MNENQSAMNDDLIRTGDSFNFEAEFMRANLVSRPVTAKQDETLEDSSCRMVYKPMRRHLTESVDVVAFSGYKPHRHDADHLTGTNEAHGRLETGCHLLVDQITAAIRVDGQDDFLTNNGVSYGDSVFNKVSPHLTSTAVRNTYLMLRTVWSRRKRETHGISTLACEIHAVHLWSMAPLAIVQHFAPPTILVIEPGRRWFSSSLVARIISTPIPTERIPDMDFMTQPGRIGTVRAKYLHVLYRGSRDEGHVTSLAFIVIDSQDRKEGKQIQISFQLHGTECCGANMDLLYGIQPGVESPGA